MRPIIHQKAKLHQTNHVKNRAENWKMDDSNVWGMKVDKHQGKRGKKPNN
jgi:hypothetical protein